MGEYEPNDSRKVTDPTERQQQQAAGGGQGQQLGHGQDPGWRTQAPSEAEARQQDRGTGQQQQFQSDSGGQMGGGADTSGASGGFAGQAAGGLRGQIREHMEVIGADGVHLGTVDAIEGDRIKLTKADSGMGSHQGHHHYLPLGLVAGIEGDRLRLSANADTAYGMEEEEGGQ